MAQRQVSEKNQGTIKIYNFQKIIANTYSLMERDLSKNNVELIRKFDKTLVNESLSEARRSKILSTLLSLSRFLEKDWQDTTKEDIEDLVFQFNEKFSDNGQETNTTTDHKKILKNFYRWYKLGSRDYRDVGDPMETKWIRIRRIKEKLTRDMLISDEEKMALLKACGENLRDRAFIHTFMDAGCRPGEILSRQIKHVTFTKHGAVLVVDGKTGPRPILVIECQPDLANYFSKHPRNSDPEAPLWIKLDDNNLGKPLSYQGMRNMLHRLCRRAGVSKRIWPNLFRHTGVTKTASFLMDEHQKKRYGWSPNSKMPGRYTHMINADVDSAMLKHYGIEEEKDEKDAANTPKICRICQMPNSFDATICSKCGIPLDIKTALRLEESERKEKEDFTQKISQLEKQQKKSNEVLDLILNMIEDAQKNNSKLIIKRDRSIPLFSQK